MKKTITYKKGKLYAPDNLDELPKDCNQYFTQDELEEWGKTEYEYGTLKCIKSFSITIIIKELP
ncbi:hypothetical protein [Thalassobellus suaedae]|uniref:Phage protein n=1 Tax=Thalassobellus suaedae TaxID=3074124 RepID=A0ABY9XVP5_9FLAO|nr:hypothetical protein RHP51_04860 [Flavobacteriaceae bacterium HL-DH14]